MKKLSEFRQEILDNRSSPHFLADIGLELGCDYAYYQEQYAEAEILKAQYMEKEEGSIASKEYRFLTTEVGNNWERLKRKIKGIEGLQKGLISINVSNSIEAKLSK